jgi:hypothetical protein
MKRSKRRGAGVGCGRPGVHTRVSSLALHAGAPLLAGALLYVGFRAESLLGWRWADALGIGAPARALRELLGSFGHVPDWVRFTAPDALWVYALTHVVARVQRGARPPERALWLSIAFALGPGAELGQFAGVVPGTFDVFDLITTLSAFGLASYFGGRAPLPEIAERTIPT